MPRPRSFRVLLVCLAASGLAIANSAWAAEGAAPASPAASVVVGEPASLSVVPATVTLSGQRARQQLLATGHYANGEVRDLTIATEYVSNNPQVAKVENGVILPVGNGTCQIMLVAAGKAAKVDVTVKGLDAPHPMSFKNEMLAALTKSGCNLGACHGSPSGKGASASRCGPTTRPSTS